MFKIRMQGIKGKYIFMGSYSKHQVCYCLRVYTPQGLAANPSSLICEFPWDKCLQTYLSYSNFICLDSYKNVSFEVSLNCFTLEMAMRMTEFTSESPAPKHIQRDTHWSWTEGIMSKPQSRTVSVMHCHKIDFSVKCV